MIRRAAAFVFQWTLWIAVTVMMVEQRPRWDHNVHGWGRELLAFAIWLVLGGIVFVLSGLIRGPDASKQSAKS